MSSDTASSNTPYWFIQNLHGVTPEHFVALRGHKPDFYTGLFHSAAAAEYSGQTEQASATHSAEWSLLLLGPDSGLQIDCVNLDDADFFEQLDLNNEPAPNPECPETGKPLPFASGWQLYLSYELAGQVEPVLKPVLQPPPQPLIAQARRVQGALLYNHSEARAWLCLEVAQETLSSTIDKDLAAVSATPSVPNVVISSVEEDAAVAFTDAVSKIHRYIRDGDVFQVNLSRGWKLGVDAEESSEAIYRQLLASNPAPFSAWVDVANSNEALSNGFELISSSPERLVSVGRVEGEQQPWVNTRPIAGTRPRSAGEPQNQQYLKELQQSPKENAEHLMLIDLERNDLGRVCQPGTIEVNELMCIESFAHVHHIVSNVRGRKRDNATTGELISAVFPGGTITGCPKVHCMEIIAELEQCTRGAYTGAVGYLGMDGQMDLNIVIRSLVRPNVTPEQLLLRAGAGIVADSDPEHELAETRAKANSVLRAFNVALGEQ